MGKWEVLLCVKTGYLFFNPSEILKNFPFDIYIFFNLRYGAAALDAQLLTCNAFKRGQGMDRAAYIQLTSGDTLNPAELP